MKIFPKGLILRAFLLPAVIRSFFDPAVANGAKFLGAVDVEISILAILLPAGWTSNHHLTPLHALSWTSLLNRYSSRIPEKKVSLFLNVSLTNIPAFCILVALPLTSIPYFYNMVITNIRKEVFSWNTQMFRLSSQ